MRVFISYNHSDNVVVEQICSTLKERSIDYFLDSKDIPYGKPISGSVKDAFETSTHLVVVISPGSNQSAWVPFEIGMATGKGIPVLPVLAHPRMKLPDFIHDLKCFRSVDEFKEHFFLVSVNSLQIEASLELLLCRDLGKDTPEFKGKFGFKELGNDAVGMSPALVLTVKNLVGRNIRLNAPVIKFLTPQDNIARDNAVQAVGFMEQDDSDIIPGAERKYLLYGFMMKGIVYAFQNGNIDSIIVSDRDGFTYQLPTEYIHRTGDLAQRFLDDFNWGIES